MSKQSKILMIEDDPDQIQLYGFKFDIEDFTFLPVTDGQTGIQIAIKEKPDLILLDILLASENGLDVLEQINKTESIKNIPVVVFSNLFKVGLEEKTKLLGATDFILKSQVTPAELVARIKTIIL